jgi:hypothetical protein
MLVVTEATEPLLAFPAHRLLTPEAAVAVAEQLVEELEELAVAELEELTVAEPQLLEQPTPAAAAEADATSAAVRQADRESSLSPIQQDAPTSLPSAEG